MNLQYFLEKNSLMIICIIAVLVSGVCIWAYLDFLESMETISDFTYFSEEELKISNIDPEIIKNISASQEDSDGKTVISPEFIKMLSASSKNNKANQKISSDVFKSLNATK